MQSVAISRGTTLCSSSVSDRGGGGLQGPSGTTAHTRLDPSVVSKSGFTPLTRRWTFASDGASDRLNKSSSCGDITELQGVFIPAAQHIDQRDLDLRRELHKASLAQELCSTVAQVMMCTWTQGGIKLMSKPDRDEAFALASEAAKLHFAKLPLRYALSVDARDVLIHMQLLAEAAKSGRVVVHSELQRLGRHIHMEPQEERQWVVTMSCRDRSHLLDAFTRALSKHVTKIVDADIMTTSDNMALDRFTVESRDPPDRQLLGRNIDVMLKKQRPGRSLSGDVGADRPRSGSPTTMSVTWSVESMSQSSGHLSAMVGRAGGRQEGEDDNGPQTGLRNDTSPQYRHPDGEPDGGEQATSTPNMGRGLEEEPDTQSVPLPSSCDPDVWTGSTPVPGPYAHDQRVAVVPYAQLVLEGLVARSGNSETYRARLRGEGGAIGPAIIAAKVLVAPTPSGPDTLRAGEARRADMCLKELWREVDVVRRLDHPNICRFHGVSQRPDGGWCMLYEFLEGGSLGELLSDKARPYDYFRVATQIAQGMAYLHDLGIMHRDLKPSNILLTRDMTVKIVDFGLACLVTPFKDLTAETGTYRYMAPEVIGHRKYGLAADVYSYGVCLWSLLVREQPFQALSPIQAAFAVARDKKRPHLPPRTPQRLAALITRCWAQDPLQRPTFREILQLLPGVQASLQWGA